jgi:hypothetical protein
MICRVVQRILGELIPLDHLVRRIVVGVLQGSITGDGGKLVDLLEARRAGYVSGVCLSDRNASCTGKGCGFGMQQSRTTKSTDQGVYTSMS